MLAYVDDKATGVVYFVEDNNKDTRGLPLKLIKITVYSRLFEKFQNCLSVKRWAILEQQTLKATSINVFETH